MCFMLMSFRHKVSFSFFVSCVWSKEQAFYQSDLNSLCMCVCVCVLLKTTLSFHFSI